MPLRSIDETGEGIMFSFKRMVMAAVVAVSQCMSEEALEERMDP